MKENNDSAREPISFFVTIEEISKHIPKLGLICALSGGFYQLIVLLMIGRGFWVLSFFSTTYAIIEGLSFLLYALLIIIISAFSSTLNTKSKVVNKIIGFILLIGTPILFFYLLNIIYFQYLIFFLFIPMISGYYMIRNKKFTILEEFNAATKKENESLLILFISCLLVSSFFVLKTNTESYKNINSIREMIEKTEKPRLIYMNDKYLFIQYNYDSNYGNIKENITIKKIEELTN